MGFHDLVNELFVNITHLDIYNRKHQLLLHEDLSHFYEEASAPLIPMSRTLLQNRLAESLPKGVLMLDHHCTDVVEEGNIVQVSFSNKDPMQADIVIGADGVHSITRSTITKTIDKQYTGICFWGGIINKELFIII